MSHNRTAADGTASVTMPCDLAVVIVTWNVRALVIDAIRSLCADLTQSGLDADSTDIWVVDSASTDGTPDAIRAAFPDVHLIAHPVNVGFGAANNIALRALGFCDTPTPNPNGPRAVFLLNPDTLIPHSAIPHNAMPSGAVRRLYDTLFASPKVGMVGAQLAYGDGSFQHSAFAFPTLAQIAIDLFPLDWLPRRVFGRLYDSRLNGRYPRAWYQGDKPFAIGHPLGAAMLLRREVIEQTGLFDEQFFMYCEEVDWAMRIQAASWLIYCEPRAHITHLSGQSTGQVRTQSLINLWRSRLRLYQKHYTPLQQAMARLLIRMCVPREVWINLGA